MTKPQSNKAKGRRLQNHVRDTLLARYAWLGVGDVESCSMGSAGVDIKMSPLARRTLPVSIECKKTRATPSRAELEQSRANAYGTTIPAVVWSPHGSGLNKSMIMMDFNEFLDWFEMMAVERFDRLRNEGSKNVYGSHDNDN